MAEQHSALATTVSTTAPTGAVRIARIGGTIAELAAAAISAHTLYHLGGQLDLGPAVAWLLPAALDVYAFTALAVGYNLPADHPGQRPVLRNARLAFAMTLGANALDHLLQKAGRLIDPTTRDLLLVAVATLPPLVVERLLNLQSLLVDQQTTAADQPEHAASAGGRETAQDNLAQNHTSPVAAFDGRSHIDPVHPTSDQNPPKTAQRPDWTSIGSTVFTDLAANLARRPSAREFQTALESEARTMAAAGLLPAGVRPPSVTTVKRVRAALEASPAPAPTHRTGPAHDQRPQTPNEVNGT